MAHLELGRSNAGLLRIVGDLTERFQAGAVGIAVYQPIQIAYGDGYVYGELIQQDRKEFDKEIKVARAEFESALHGRAGGLEWRSTMTLGSLSGYLAQEARSADLVITSVDRAVSIFDTSRHINLSELVMEVGRPLLIVPTAVSALKFDRVLVGWKDTRETRRAVVDALPFLKRTAHVAVVEIVAEGAEQAARARLEDVVGWLKRHGVVAEPIVSSSAGSDVTRLNAIAEDQRADLVVAGAYGHSRVREWMLGGVTRDLLSRAERCLLLSH
jgi:nucleotide-binding universal stress UspA family protein